MSNKYQDKGLKYLFSVLKFVLLSAFVLFTLFPFYWLLITSIKAKKDLYEVPIRYWPSSITFENYIEVFKIGNFPLYIFNSLLIAITSALFVVVISSMSAYILSRYQFRSRGIVFMVFMMTQMLPVAVGFAPMYVLMSKLGMVNRISTVILLLVGGQIPFGTILLIGFMKGIPKAIEEAAMIDGCSRVKSFFLIMLPMSKSGLFSVFIFVFLTCWNDVYTSVLYLDSSSKRTLTVAIYAMIGKYDINWGNVAAGTFIAIIPAVLLFSFMKEIFVENISGAVKE